jgi:hypothetical protein
MSNVIDMKAYRAALRSPKYAADRTARNEQLRESRREVKRHRETLAQLSKSLPLLVFDPVELERALDSMRHGTLTEDEIDAANWRVIQKVLDS